MKERNHREHAVFRVHCQECIVLPLTDDRNIIMKNIMIIETGRFKG